MEGDHGRGDERGTLIALEKEGRKPVDHADKKQEQEDGNDVIPPRFLDSEECVLEGIKGGYYEVIPDRRSAIQKTIEIAKKGDFIVIAGKGHENYQIIGVNKIHFDDKEIASEFIQERFQK